MEKPILKDSGVRFDEVEHRYWLGNKELLGITSTLVHRAFPDTYKDIPAEVLMRAAQRGTNVHECIQFCEENGLDSDMPEFKSYQGIKFFNNLTYVTHEYIVTDGKRYASPIDLVFVDGDGKIVLADIKTTYVPHYDNVALQLSIYKRFFEMQNPDLKVDRCALIWLRDDKHEYKEMAIWADELLNDLFDADEKDVPFDITNTYGNLPQKVYDVQEYLCQLEADVKAKTEELKTIKDGLCQMMLDRGIKSFTTPMLKMTTITPKPKKTFDSKSFSEAYPDLYNEYLKESIVKPSVRITYK